MTNRIKAGWPQLLVVLCVAVVTFFVFSVAERSAQARELLEWRDELQDEIAQLERDKVNLQTELARRQQPGWYEEVLRDAGYISEGDVRVVVVTREVEAVDEDSTVVEPAADFANERRQGWFVNDNWRAWQVLLWGTREGS